MCPDENGQCKDGTCINQNVAKRNMEAKITSYYKKEAKNKKKNKKRKEKEKENKSQIKR